MKELAGEPAVAQKYVPRPLLLRGLKFDLRVYALVTAAVPRLRAFVHSEGLARFATVPYAVPRASNLETARMHLTNYAVNRGSDAFAVASEGDGGDGASRGASKQRLSAVLRQLSAIGAPPALLAHCRNGSSVPLLAIGARLVLLAHCLT